MRRHILTPSAEQVAQTFYGKLREGVTSGSILFELHEDFPFTRPGLPVRRWRALDDTVELVPRGSAMRAAGNLAVSAATLLDEAGRQQEVPPRTLKTIGSHVIALELLGDELALDNENGEALKISAGDMSQKIDDQYADWIALPPEHVVTITQSFDLTAGIAQEGLRLLQEKLISEAV